MPWRLWVGLALVAVALLLDYRSADSRYNSVVCSGCAVHMLGMRPPHLCDLLDRRRLGHRLDDDGAARPALDPFAMVLGIFRLLSSPLMLLLLLGA